jgi:hypothetical protein
VPALLIVGTDLIRDMEIFDGVTSNITFRRSPESIPILLMPRIHIGGKGAWSQHLTPWVSEILLIWKNISHENSHNKIPHL